MRLWTSRSFLRSGKLGLKRVLTVGAGIGRAAACLILSSSAWAAAPPQYSILYTFPTPTPQNSGPLGPGTSLVVGPDGNLYGATPAGGYSFGTIFSITPSGTFTNVYTYPQPGAFSYAAPSPMVVGADGALYGIDIANSASVFRLTTGGVFSIIANAAPASFLSTPYFGLLAAYDGNLYAFGNNDNNIGIYQITLAGNVTLLHTFNPATEGSNPNRLIQGFDGFLYGTTTGGGSAAGHGTFFRMKLDGTFTIISPFPITSGNLGPEGAAFEVVPDPGGLAQGSDGNFYSFGRDVNGNDDRLIFQLTPAGSLTWLKDLSYPPQQATGQLDAPMIPGADGNLYGKIQLGSNWTIFQLTTLGVLTPLYQGNLNKGVSSDATGLVQAPDGTFYGAGGGINDPNGYIFRFGPGTGGSLTPLLYTGPALLDAQPNFVTQDSVNAAPSGLVSDPSLLIGSGRAVVGAAADGVSRVLLRGATASTLVFTLLDENMNPIGHSTEYGGLAQVTGPGTPFSNAIPIQPAVVNGNSMAFVAYRAPMDFVRSDPNFNASDQMANSRTVNIQVAAGDGTVVSTYPITLVRPPVVVIHGITSEPRFWKTFKPLVNNCAAPTVSGDPRFYVLCADWSKIVPGVISIDPNYLGVGSILMAFQPIKQNVLGYAYNAPVVFGQMQNTVANYSLAAPPAGNQPVASVQVDAVGHSMGNLVARTMPYALLPPNSYLQTSNYGVGIMHKLISIAGPHFGSPMAIVTLDPKNACSWIAVAVAGDYPLNSANFGLSVTSGGALDLTGDGQGNCVSTALNTLQGTADKQIPVALIAGEMSDAQLNGLNSSLQALAVKLVSSVKAVQLACSTDYFMPNYDAAGWLTFMRTTSANQSDAFVPVTSALDGLGASGACIVPTGQTPPVPCNLSLIQYAVHGPGTTAEIGFPEPEMLDNPTVPMVTINLLNAQVGSPAFSTLPSVMFNQVGGCK